MSTADMEHMAPVPIDGIANAPSDTCGVPLTGTRRNGALEFKLEAGPVWWPILPEIAAYA